MSQHAGLPASGEQAANGINEPSFLMRAASTASVGVALFLIAVKVFALAATDSVAMLSSLIDSSLDAAASFLNFWAIRQSLMPADRSHRFGHGKVEPLASLGQAAFIIGSAVLLVFQSIQYILRPRVVENVGIGMGAMVISILMTLGLVMFQKYVVRKTKSVAISADYAHYAGDVMLNLSVMLSLFIGAHFHFRYADPIFALLIAVYLLFNAGGILKTSFMQLVDTELPVEEKRKITQVVMNHPDVRGMHDLRTRSSGTQWFIQLHLEIDPKLTLSRAHAIADEVEDSLCRAFPNAEVFIHEDPAGLYEQHPDWCYDTFEPPEKNSSPVP